MSIFRPFVSVAVALSLLVFATVVSGEESVEDFFRAFKEKRDGIGSLHATFVQKTFLPQEVITTEGILHYSKPRRILFSTEEPERSILVDGRRGYESEAEIKQMTIFDIEDHPRANIFFLGFDDDTEALKTAYQLTLIESDDERGKQGIKITPRPDSEEAVYFVEANLYLRDEDYLPYRIHIVNDEESQLFIDVSDIVKKAEEDLAGARIHIPQGVKIVENDRVIDTVSEDSRPIPGESAGILIKEQELPDEESPDKEPEE